MSQNAMSRPRGLEKGSYKTNQTDLNKGSVKSNSNSKSTKQNIQNSNEPQKAVIQQQSTQVVPTNEQLRLAQLIGNKSEDPEINKKIKQVLDIVPTKKQDDILMILHQNDYDVPKTIEYLLDGGDLTDDWKTAGKQKKTVASPTKETEAENKTHSSSKFNRHNKNLDSNDYHNEQNGNRSKADRNRKFEGKNSRRHDNLNHDNVNLDEKLGGMHIQEGADQNPDDQLENNDQQQMNAQRRGNNRNSTRGSRGGFGRGSRGGFERSERGERGVERQNGRGDRVERHRETEPRASNESDLIDERSIETVDPSLDSNATSNTLSKEHENNLRDIGTWSNEQAASEKAVNNRRLNKANYLQNNGARQQQDDVENEEEWQGDLSQTQIFTASSQAKKNDTDFPIGHFNTEEAAQKIKKAIGIAIISNTNLVENVPILKAEKPAIINVKPEDKSKLVKGDIQQTVRLNKFGSVKPPPPSTKIPKSAVIMPGGGSNTGFSLDVQFGVDIEIPKSKPEPVKEPVSQQPASNAPVTKASSSQQQRHNEQIPNPSLPQLNTFDAIKNLTAENQKIGVVNPVVVNKQTNVAKETGSTLIKSLPIENNNVPSLPSALKVDMSQTNTLSSSQQSYVHQQQAPKQLVQEMKKPQSENTFIGDAQHQQKQYMQLQNQIQQQQLSSIQKSSQHPNVNSKQYLNQLNQDVSVASLNSQSLNNNNLNNITSAQHNNYQNQLNSLNNNQMKSSNSSHSITPNTSQPHLHNQVSPQNSQKQQNSGNLSTNTINSSASINSGNKPSNNINNGNNSAMPPPPGVNMINPQNNQFMMGLPFQQQFPYFDPTQMDGNSIMQMYNHLASVAPPGVGSASGAGGTAQYSINDTKFNRSQDSAGTNSQLNPNAQLSQQQQPINMIPGLSNFPFFFHNYYPNMFMSMPQNGPQQQGNPQQQFQNKPQYNNFNNASGGSAGNVNDYDVQTSNLGNVSEIGYPKNVDKSNSGYHTPPPNYSNSLMNQQQPHPNGAGNNGAPLPPNQYAYINSMIGTQGVNPGNPLVSQHQMQQDNINARGMGNNGTNSIKQLQKTANYQNSPWS